MITKYIAEIQIESTCSEDTFGIAEIQDIITRELYEYGADVLSVVVSEQKPNTKET